MKRLLMISLLFTCSINLPAQQYNAVDAGSSVKFSIKNFGLNVNGSFTGLHGRIIFDPANLSAASFNVTVDAATVNTGNGSRDKHLKKEDYFDVAKYTTLSFASAKITGSAGNYSMQGMLTIKAVSKNISFPFTATATANGYRFSGQFKINRRDFNVGGGSWVLSDELTVTLNVSATK